MRKMRNKLNFIKKYKSLSIGNKITLLYAAVFTVTFITLTVFIMLNTWYYYQGVSENELLETMDKVISYIKSDNEIAADEISKLSPNRNIEIRLFVGKDGDEKIDMINKQPYKNPHFPPPLKNKEDFDKKKERFETETVKGIHYMSRRNIVEHKGKQYFIEVFRTNESERAVLRDFAIVFIVANVLGIIASFGIGRFISKKVLNPISEITRTAERISINDLSKRINVPESDDEVSNLAVTFNDMLGRLENSFEKQKQFVSNASHELKTPISVIQGYASLMDRWGKSDPEILQESIDSIKDETEYMSNLINKLFFLAKNEQSEKIDKIRISLNGVVSEVIKEVAVLGINGEFNIIGDKEVNVMGDSNLIKQLLWIFFENAIKYSDKDYIKVDVHLYCEKEFSVMKISDNGMGIKRDDIPYIFDRFFRGDKSHNKTVSGNGLGLSIAEIIVRNHDGKIEVFSEEKKGTNFIIRFPKA